MEFENLGSGIPRFHGMKCSQRNHVRIKSTAFTLFLLGAISKCLPMKEVRKCSLDKL